MRLKYIRNEALLNQEELANILGVSRNVYSNWEQERSTISIEQLNKFCNYFNVSFDYVLELTNERNYENINNNIDYKLITKRLKVIRKINNLTQAELAQKLNIARSAISKYENNINKSLLTYLTAFAKYFNISVDYLVGRTNEEIKLKKLVQA